MANTGVRTSHLLIVGNAVPCGGLADWMEEHSHITRVENFDAALAAMNEQEFDVVISSGAALAPLQETGVTRQTATLLDSLSQGVCIVGEGGTLERSNPTMLNYAESTRERICRCCMETLRWAQTEVVAGASKLRGRRFGFSNEEDESFEVTATPIIDPDERITQVAAVIRNTTNVRRLQDKIDAIDRAGRELLSLDTEQVARLDAQERLALLEQKLIRCTKELLHFENFAIRILNKSTNRLELVLTSGFPAERQDVDLAVGVEENGICGYVAARGRSYTCPDTDCDPRFLPGIGGARSSLTVPLLLHDKVVGVANFESTKRAAFNEDSRQFAEIFARYVSLALHMLELLVSERQTTTGRLGSDVMAEITGPLNDILTDVEGLVEDYIGHDDLRHRLRTISSNAVRIRESIKEITSPKAGVVGARAPRTKLCDPILAGKRILIADDEDTIRETVRDVLLGYGCEVTAVEDGGEAVDLVSRERFDLVLSDIKMPCKSGYQVFAATKEANAQTPVILTTGFGYDPNHSIVRARREGLAAVLFKPFKVDQLLDELRMALKSSAS